VLLNAAPAGLNPFRDQRVQPATRCSSAHVLWLSICRDFNNIPTAR